MTKRLISASLLVLTAWGCKPKAASSLDSITGVNAAGEEAALSLIPVRNFSASNLAGGDAGVQQAAAMAKTRLFALVECVAAKHKKTGKTISATDLMAAVELRAAIDDLYVDQNRALLTSADDAALADYGSTNKLIAVPCHIHGERLLSWPVITDLQLQAAGLPKTLPSSAGPRALTMSTYSVVQAIHQGFRGSYTEDASKDFMPRVPALLNMIEEQGGGEATAAAVIKRIKDADKFFNACSKQDTKNTTLPYASQLRGKSYACTPESGRAGMFSYRAGGASGKNYETVKNLISTEITRTHAAVFARSQNDDGALFGLWEILTSTKKWGNYGGTSHALANFLVSGKDFDFASTFASKANGAVAAPGSDPKVQTSELDTAPLAIAIPVGLVQSGKRDQFIQRAEGGGGARGLFVGGTTSSASGRGKSVADRVRGAGSQMGAAGSFQLKALEASVHDAMAIIRN